MHGQLRGLRTFSSVGRRLARKSSAEALPLRAFCHAVSCSAGRVCNAQAMQLTRLHRSEWCCDGLSVYLHFMHLCQQLHILVSLGLMPCDVVLEVCNDCSVESTAFAAGPRGETAAIKLLILNHAVTLQKTWEQTAVRCRSVRMSVFRTE